MGPKLEDIDDLMHNIQSRLPIKEAARTSVLSKSWLHAWSTIPTLRFNVLKGKQLKLIDMDRTLIRYLRDNIPIETFNLMIDIENQESASHVAKLIGPMASKPFLKEISLLIFLKGTSFMLPNEILASENLTKIKVSYPIRWNHSVWMTNTPVINCVSLRELRLDGVCMSEEVLNHILSSCKLLEKISLLYCCKGFKTIRVKNLSRLYKLKISLEKDNDNGCFTTLDIVNVPNLDVFSFDVQVRRLDMPLIPFNAHSIGSNVTQLKLVGMITDIACLDKIKSGFPLLGCLTLGLESWKLESFHFTFSPSLKLIVLQSCPNTLTDVKIHAKNLRFFEFKGKELPTSLLFPVSTLKQTNFTLSPNLPIDVNFFVRMREALTLSRTFYLRIKIKKSNVVPVDIDHLRTRLMFPPATNVESLWFETIGDEGVWERSLFFDAFFEICHPKYVYAMPDVRFKHNNHFFKLMLKEVLDKNTNKTGTACWSHYLKHVRIRRALCKKWKTLKDSHRSLLDGSAPAVSMYFKLNWC